jgi:ubiquinone/menaquinone biosynthesis C-methylase UbiE
MIGSAENERNPHAHNQEGTPVIVNEVPAAEFEAQKKVVPVGSNDADRIEKVRTLFDQRSAYLDRRQLDIRLRRETVDRLVQGKQYSQILDIGCGDGSISTPLLNSKNNLTLLDVSPGMLSIARSNIPEELQSRVKFVNQDFMQVPFEQGSFDLVICVGVLAHVVSPAQVIAKITSILKPGGMLILECTNGHHFLDQLNQMRNQLAWLIRPPKYKMNILNAPKICETAINTGLKKQAEFAYGLPLPFTGRFYTPESAYAKTRKMFGDVDQNRNRWLASQHIYCFTR